MCRRFSQRRRPGAAQTEEETAEKPHVVHQRSDRQFGKRYMLVRLSIILLLTLIYTYIYGIIKYTFDKYQFPGHSKTVQKSIQKHYSNESFRRALVCDMLHTQILVSDKYTACVIYYFITVGTSI